MSDDKPAGNIPLAPPMPSELPPATPKQWDPVVITTENMKPTQPPRTTPKRPASPNSSPHTGALAAAVEKRKPKEPTPEEIAEEKARDDIINAAAAKQKAAKLAKEAAAAKVTTKRTTPPNPGPTKLFNTGTAKPPAGTAMMKELEAKLAARKEATENRATATTPNSKPPSAIKKPRPAVAAKPQLLSTALINWANATAAGETQAPPATGTLLPEQETKVAEFIRLVRSGTDLEDSHKNVLKESLGSVMASKIILQKSTEHVALQTSSPPENAPGEAKEVVRTDGPPALPPRIYQKGGATFPDGQDRFTIPLPPKEEHDVEYASLSFEKITAQGSSPSQPNPKGPESYEPVQYAQLGKPEDPLYAIVENDLAAQAPRQTEQERDARAARFAAETPEEKNTRLNKYREPDTATDPSKALKTMMAGTDPNYKPRGENESHHKRLNRLTKVLKEFRSFAMNPINTMRGKKAEITKDRTL